MCLPPTVEVRKGSNHKRKKGRKESKAHVGTSFLLLFPSLSLRIRISFIVTSLDYRSTKVGDVFLGKFWKKMGGKG